MAFGSFAFALAMGLMLGKSECAKFAVALSKPDV